MHLDLRHLELISAIVDEGSVTKAGERLHLTQSALSCQLKEAEKRLGTLLFRRLGRRMVLTPAGERLLRASRIALREIDEAEREIRTMSAAAPPPVRLATECFTCYTWLPSLLQRLHRRAPDIEVSIAAEYTRSSVPALLKGDLDVAIITANNADRRLQLTPLFVDEMIAAVPIRHHLASRKWIEARDLAPEHVVTFDAPRENLTLFTDIMDPAGLKPGRHTRMQLSEAMIELVKAGIAIAIMPRWVVASHSAASQMRLVRLTRKGIRRQWSAATLRTRNLPQHIQEFTSVLSEQMQEGTLFSAA